MTEKICKECKTSVLREGDEANICEPCADNIINEDLVARYNQLFDRISSQLDDTKLLSEFEEVVRELTFREEE